MNDRVRGFRDVDSAPAEKIEMMRKSLEFMDSLPSFQQYKNAILKEIRPNRGYIVADLGCGLGFDVRRIAELVAPDGLAIGVDSSNVFLESARLMNKNANGIEFIRADIQRLPFENGYLHACKVDRTLQHIENPSSVIEEIFRTLRSGGTVACAEPDWDTYTIEHENAAMARRITQVGRERIRNPWIGRRLSDELRQAGFIDVKTQDMVLAASTFESSDKVFNIASAAAFLADAEASEEPLQWISDAKERDRAHPVSSYVTLVLNVARKP